MAWTLHICNTLQNTKYLRAGNIWRFLTFIIIISFYHCFSYRSEPFSAHFVARFITEHHFVAIYACSEPHVLPAFIAMALCCVARTTNHPQARPRDRIMLALKKTRVQTVCYFLDKWTLGHVFVKVGQLNAAIVSSILAYKLQTTPLSSSASPTLLRETLKNWEEPETRLC